MDVLIGRMNDGGEQIAEGLAGAGLGNRDQIQAGEGNGPALSLNRGRTLEKAGI